MSEKIVKLPDDFFKKNRPKVDNKETFKDVEPIKWSKDVTEKIKKQLYI